MYTENCLLLNYCSILSCLCIYSNRGSQVATTASCLHWAGAGGAMPWQRFLGGRQSPHLCTSYFWGQCTLTQSSGSSSQGRRQSHTLLHFSPAQEHPLIPLSTDATLATVAFTSMHTTFRWCELTLHQQQGLLKALLPAAAPSRHQRPPYAQTTGAMEFRIGPLACSSFGPNSMYLFQCKSLGHCSFYSTMAVFIMMEFFIMSSVNGWSKRFLGMGNTSCNIFSLIMVRILL